MGKAKGKHRLDKFYYLAKEQGYRSRAAFKLVQLDVKFSFLSSSRSILDLCAAPGGWMQVAVQRAPVSSFVLGVDLFPIRPIRGALSIEEDITTQKCRSSIKKLMNEHGCSAFDLVLHDGSPNVGGAWAQEATSQSALVIDAVKLASEFLVPKGTFVTKVFRSQDYSAILYCLKQLFEKVEVTKPVASRSTSAEIYVVGLRYKAPAKIDPRLLNVKHLFQGAIEPPKVVDVLRGTKQKRHRDGYEDGNTTLRKTCLASDFVWSDAPLNILGSITSITFDDSACQSIKDHILTTEEMKVLCDDLQVLGKQDFKHLLKWRLDLRKALSPAQKAEPKPDIVEARNDDDEQLLDEIEGLTCALEKKKKHEKKLLAKRRAKDKVRKATGMQVDVMEDGYTDQELFSLKSIRGKKELEAIDNAELNDDQQSSDEEEPHANHVLQESCDLDIDQEKKLHDTRLEELLDEAYERYITRKGGSTITRKRARMRANNGDELLEGGDEEDLHHSHYDSDNDNGDMVENPLLIPLNHGEQSTQDQITKTWYSQDVFTEAVADGALGKDDSKHELCKMSMKPKKFREEENSSKNITPPKILPSEDFEVVSAEVTYSSDDSTSSDESDVDDDTKAEVLTYAKKMLRKKQREEILDDSYNKYMFDDEGLPTWFLEEEKKHRQPIKPVTKEEILAMKAQFREIDARPAKKVAQAKARKKRAAMRTLEKVRRKANQISEQTDVADRSKGKMIEQLYKKAAPKRPKKEYVVAKKGVQVKAGKGRVLVDRRMKKDSRSKGNGSWKKGRGSKKASTKKSSGVKISAKNSRGSAKATGKVGRNGKR